MPLTLQKSTFHFVDEDLRSISVQFTYGVGGDPVDVLVYWNGGMEVKYDNQDKKWRACVTHARELVRLATGKKSVGPFAKARAKSSRPPLRLANLPTE